MAANIPDITQPVSRAGAGQLGITMNFGTSGGGQSATNAGQVPIGGGSNVGIGGSVTQGGVSFQQAPVNASTVVRDVYNGVNGVNPANSQNPLTIQNDSANAVASEYVARTSNVVASASEGYHTDAPRANTSPELPANGAGVGAVKTVSMTLNNGTVYGNYTGGENSAVYGSVDNQTALNKIVSDTFADVYADRVGNGGPSTTAGGNKIGDPTPQNRDENTNGEVSNTATFN